MELVWPRSLGHAEQGKLLGWLKSLGHAFIHAIKVEGECKNWCSLVRLISEEVLAVPHLLADTLGLVNVFPSQIV